MRVAFQKAHVENEDKNKAGWGRGERQKSNIAFKVGRWGREEENGRHMQLL